MDEEPKAKSKSVSLLPDLWDDVEAIASARYNGNRSSYIRELVTRDMEGAALGTVFTREQIDRWMDDEVALVRAARIAATFSNTTDAQTRDKLAREMAEIILSATIRVPASESKNTYGVRAKPRQDIHAPRGKKSESKTA